MGKKLIKTIKEMFEDTKGETRSRRLKERQYNDRKETKQSDKQRIVHKKYLKIEQHEPHY